MGVPWHNVLYFLRARYSEAAPLQKQVSLLKNTLKFGLDQVFRNFFMMNSLSTFFVCFSIINTQSQRHSIHACVNCKYVGFNFKETRKHTKNQAPRDASL